MTVYTDAASRPGQKLRAGDDRALFARMAARDVITAYDETYAFANEVTDHTIETGRSKVIPIIGRTNNAQDHIPGEIILGGTEEHNEVELVLDNMTYDSKFIPEIDELMAQYSLSAPYTKNLGNNLASTSNDRAIRTMILASRETVAPYTGAPLPSFAFHANMATDASKLEDAAFAGVENNAKYNIGGGDPTFWLPWKQYLLLSRYTGIDSKITSGSGNRAQGTTGAVAGIMPKGANFIPNTNITTGLAKYRGDFTPTVGIITNSLAVARLKRRAMRFTIKDQPDRLGTLMIASQLEGYNKYRCECAFEVRNVTR